MALLARGAALRALAAASYAVGSVLHAVWSSSAHARMCMLMFQLLLLLSHQQLLAAAGAGGGCNGASPPRCGWRLPTVHHRPPCLGDLSAGWHDIAATITHRGVHHVWQGCPGAKTKPGGWAHSHSSDLVSWTFSDISPSDAGTSPLAGFVQLDDSGVPCAGFNQRHVPGHPMPWNTPLGVVCAKNAALTEWGEPEILFPVNFWKGLPYDPIAPWRDEDGRWYATIALDACNATGHAAGSKGRPVGKPFPDGGFCARGGELDLWTSPVMHGPKAHWTHITQPMFVSNVDVLPQARHTDEFVTPNFFGGIPGDPRGGRTRVLTNNAMVDNGTTEYYIGLQANGSAFDLLPPQQQHSNVGKGSSSSSSSRSSVGMLDWGAFSPHNASSKGLAGLSASQSRGQSMCRTLGSEGGNQVARRGRRVLVCWLGLANRCETTPTPSDPFFRIDPIICQDRLGTNERYTVNSNKEVVHFAHYDMQLHRSALGPL